MVCEKCSQEIEAVTCNRCGSSIIELGPFCYRCGHNLRGQEASSGPTEGLTWVDSSDAIDFSTRVLCSDGACIGVVNEQGICKVCGRPYIPES